MRKVKASGRQRMVQLGHQRVDAWLSAQEYAALEELVSTVPYTRSRVLRTLIRAAVRGGAEKLRELCRIFRE